MTTLLSWNVNGLRAAVKKGFLEWFRGAAPDILCLQETKSSPEQLAPDVRDIAGYRSYFSSAERKGYSGVALYTRTAPQRIETTWGDRRYSNEGRILLADYGRLLLCNVYFPNGKASKERLAYKMGFYRSFMEWSVGEKTKGKKLIVCGDVNTAHREIDLARPKENEKVSGFLPEERAWIDAFLSNGFVDSLRLFYPEQKDLYTWWDLKSRARERNVGWRIDYFFVSENLKRDVAAAFILADTTGSDHCPVGIRLKGHIADA